jgi:hypothetical protein
LTAGFPADSSQRDDQWPKGPCDHLVIQRVIITIQGPGWEDLEDIELSQLPGEGEPIETKYGTCIVTEAQATPDAEQHDGRITCRLP